MTLPIEDGIAKRISSIFWGRTRMPMPYTAKWGRTPLQVGLAYGREDVEPSEPAGTELFTPAIVESQANEPSRMVEILVGIDQDRLDRFRQETGVNLYDLEDEFVSAVYQLLTWLREKEGLQL